MIRWIISQPYKNLARNNRNYAEKEVGVVCFNKNVTFVYIRRLFFKTFHKKNVRLWQNSEN